MTLFLAAMIALSLGARVMLGFDPETPDHHAYLLPAMFALWLLAIAGIAKLCAMALSATRPLPKAPAISALALALLVPIQVASQWPRSSQATSWASDDLAHWAVRDVPPGSLLLIAYFQTGFRLWALQAVEGSRPDLTILDRSFLTYPGMAEQAKFHHPELAALIDSPLRAGQQSPVAMLRELAAQRPIYAELHPNVDQTLGAALRPHGAFAQLVDEGEPTRAEHDQQASLALDQLMARAGRGEREEARAALLWHDATRMDQYCVLGARSAAASVYAHALRLAPDDLMLDAMASACGLTKP